MPTRKATFRFKNLGNVRQKKTLCWYFTWQHDISAKSHFKRAFHTPQVWIFNVAETRKKEAIRIILRVVEKSNKQWQWKLIELRNYLPFPLFSFVFWTVTHYFLIGNLKISSHKGVHRVWHRCMKISTKYTEEKRTTGTIAISEF